MTYLWRTLLIIALCMQMASVALASYALYTPHEHHHSHSEGVASDDAHLAHSSDHIASCDLAECGAEHHHCTASHLTLLLQTHLSASVDSLSQVFRLSAVTVDPTDLLASIERPKWATV
jgi:hypothetical protein